MHTARSRNILVFIGAIALLAFAVAIWPSESAVVDLSAPAIVGNLEGFETQPLTGYSSGAILAEPTFSIEPLTGYSSGAILDEPTFSIEPLTGYSSGSLGPVFMAAEPLTGYSSGSPNP